MIRTTIYLSEELHKKLKLMAVRENRSMGNMIEEALALTVFLEEKGRDLPRDPKIKEAVKEITEDIKKAGLVKQRGELNGEDYTG